MHNLEGKVVGSLTLPELLESSINKALLWQAVRQYRANQRQGTAQTKTRGEVQGGGKKPWAQKHTGRARQGTIRSPLWRKGGVVFGPHPREHRYSLPIKLKREALVESLKTKVEEKALIGVESLDGLEPKTKALHLFLHRINVKSGALLVVEQPSQILSRISRNLPKVRVRPASDLTCYEVLAHPAVVVTSGAWKKLEGMLS